MNNLTELSNLSVDEITHLLDRSEYFAEHKDQVLAGKTVCTYFVENSTRTRLSFEHAARLLGAHVMTLSATGSSMAKGETERDTVWTVQAMGIDALVFRHRSNDSVSNFLEWMDVPVLNGGSGVHAHPTQGLLDLLTIRQHFGTIEGKKVCIVGDVTHSRVARSLVASLPRMGARVTMVAPDDLWPEDIHSWPVEIESDLDKAIRDVDVVYLLRIQHERMSNRYDGIDEYIEDYGFTEERSNSLDDHVIVMHPGPINRGVEIASSVADGPRSLILKQVANGVNVRMAALDWAINSNN